MASVPQLPEYDTDAALDVGERCYFAEPATMYLRVEQMVRSGSNFASLSIPLFWGIRLRFGGSRPNYKRIDYTEVGAGMLYILSYRVLFKWAEAEVNFPVLDVSQFDQDGSSIHLEMRGEALRFDLSWGQASRAIDVFETVRKHPALHRRPRPFRRNPLKR